MPSCAASRDRPGDLPSPGSFTKYRRAISNDVISREPPRLLREEVLEEREADHVRRDEGVDLVEEGRLAAAVMAPERVPCTRGRSRA